MPRKCIVIGCKSNYDSTLKTSNHVTTFSFPKDENRRKLWISAIPRKNWTPSKNAVVCIKHFHDKHVIKTQPYKRKDGNMMELLLQHPRVTEDAVPQLFDNLPSYLSEKLVTKRRSPDDTMQECMKKSTKKIKTSNYKIKMQDLEYSKSLPKYGYRKIHAKRHRLPLQSSSCERNNLEKYYCKGCNFETDLVVILKQHFREYHRKDTDCVQDQPKNDTVVRSYICQKCSFETNSFLIWIKHLSGSCFNTKEECENVSEEEWYRSECCSFKTKEATVLEKHQAAKQSRHHFHWYSCDKCEFKTKRNDSLKRHNKIHLPADAVQWYSCDKCNYKTIYKGNFKKHNIIHLPVHGVQWLSCDKCKYKTKRDHCLIQHKKKHLSADTVK
ncbi:RE1-silencing transcription factor B-like [Tenebrio molitor]|uniref:RE1-silencing transcription factor B-like n=1 Tax=Tenebrio molitor TaxID=7067 RepID=UPI0036249461